MAKYNLLRRLLRRWLRRVLTYLSRWALKKHKPQIIAIVGEGKTGIAREAIYRVLKSKHPVRRNIEAPDAEFVLPLIVLGTKEYPHSFLTWLKVLLKSIGQLVLRHSYKHLLVLEIGYSNKEIFDYFWELTHPTLVVICGNAPYLSKDQRAKKTINISETGDLKPYLKAAIKVAKFFDVDERTAKKSLAQFSLPPARIRIIPAKGGGVVVDATHQYYPPSEESIGEVLEALPGKKIFLTPETLQQKKEERDKLGIGKGEVGILMGQKKKMWPLILELTKTPWSD